MRLWTDIKANDPHTLAPQVQSIYDRIMVGGSEMNVQVTTHDDHQIWPGRDFFFQTTSIVYGLFG